MAELIWEGKYTKDHQRVGPIRIALPFQTVETVNESPIMRARQFELFAQGRKAEWRNRLIWGDKKYVLPSLQSEFANKVKLIYIDPPFATGTNFSISTIIPETSEKLTKEPNIIEQKAYRDTWGQGIDKYLQWFYETLLLLYDLLTEDGSMYVHCDWRLNSALRMLMDEAFGPSGFRNEIIWVKNSLGAKGSARQYPRNQDTILFYTKSENYTFNKVMREKEEIIEIINGKERLPTGYKRDETGRYYWTSPKGDYTDESIRALRIEGRVEEGKSENIRIKYFVTRRGNRLIKQSVVNDIWDDIQVTFRSQDMAVGYPTQKPEALLKRIITASSNEDDIILDCFCGSGTTAVVAEKLRRRWIACDLGRFAIHATRERLLNIEQVRPFVIQNLGRYERQAWQVAEFNRGNSHQAAEVQLNYRHFMLKLYRAQPLEGSIWLHGVRDGKLVHIGGVDAPVAQGDIQSIVREIWKIRGSASKHEIDILGWDFAFELHEVARQMAAEANVVLKFKRIPRDVLDRKLSQQGDIRFFELAALNFQISQWDREGLNNKEQPYGRHVVVTLIDFIIPYDDVPEEVRQSIRSWSQWIDYWAVDWDYRGDTFHNMTQTYRSRKEPKLQTSLHHTYQQSGTYTIVVKVIDLLGNDTTRTLKIEVH